MPPQHDSYWENRVKELKQQKRSRNRKGIHRRNTGFIPLFGKQIFGAASSEVPPNLVLHIQRRSMRSELRMLTMLKVMVHNTVPRPGLNNASDG